ncbi:MAG: DUF6544 family protein [Thermoleophilia bacterium]
MAEPRRFARAFRRIVAEELARHPPGGTPALAEADLGGLPDPVRRFVRASGAIGRPRPVNMRVRMTARMYRRPGAAPFAATSEQYNVFRPSARLYLMRARMLGLPVRALHVYRREEATFRVRVAALVDMVDLSGEDISRAETVTVLNDMCVLAPGTLVDPRLSWSEVDDGACEVTFTNGPHRVSARLVFNERDELVDFTSHDRPESEGGRLVPRRWRTPLDGHRDVGGMWLPTQGRAVYEHPDGPFTYGEFTITSVEYDVMCGGLPA